MGRELNRHKTIEIEPFMWEKYHLSKNLKWHTHAHTCNMLLAFINLNMVEYKAKSTVQLF